MRTCDLCHTSSEEKPLTVYADLELENFVYLCPDCKNRILSKTGGIIPLGPILKLKGGVVGEERGEGKSRGGDYRGFAKRGMDFGRTAVIVFGH